MKSVRHAMILDIIESADIETQEELADELSKRGIVVTQATVSRDIKELRPRALRTRMRSTTPLTA